MRAHARMEARAVGRVSSAHHSTRSTLWSLLPPPLPCCSGVLGSRVSPALLLAGGLAVTAVLNVAFGFSTALVWFCVFWAANGMLQARASCAACRRRVLHCTRDRGSDDARRGAPCWLPPPGGPVLLVAGRWRAMLRAHSDFLVCCQGARHVLGHVEHRAQHGRLSGAHCGGHRCQGARRAAEICLPASALGLPARACPCSAPTRVGDARRPRADVRVEVGHVCAGHHWPGHGVGHPADRARLARGW